MATRLLKAVSAMCILAVLLALAPVAAVRSDGGAPDRRFEPLVWDEIGMDYGDVLDPPYPTKSGRGGPCHLNLAGRPFPYMGASNDPDSDGQPSEMAQGDDMFDGSDDEDGLVDPGGDLTLVQGSSPAVHVVVTNPTAWEATLYGWIDYNGDGVFDNATERASVAVPSGTVGAVVVLDFPQVPEGAAQNTFARFRMSILQMAQNPTGLALFGEVEDYAVDIQPTLVELSAFGAFEDAGRAVVFWETCSQIDTAGFYLWRLDEATGRYAPVNRELVPAFFGASGDTYCYVDEAAEPGGTYTYKLVEIEFGGSQNEYGPFTVKVYRSQGR